MEPPEDAAPQLAAHREGFLVGAAVGAALAAAPAGTGAVALAPAGRRRAATALADTLLTELTSGGVDLRRLAGRWVDWQREDGFDSDPLLALALDHLRDYDAPIAELPSGSCIALAAALPAALASASPRAMIAGTFHVARLLDPAESTALAAVAIVLAASAFLEGRRDFVPDVVAALRANDAPPALLEAIRTVPRDPTAEPAVPRGDAPDPVVAATWLLWIAHHKARGVSVLRDVTLVSGITPAIGALLGALLGARDGVEGWPTEWLVGNEVAARRAVAARLAGAAREEQ